MCSCTAWNALQASALPNRPITTFLPLAIVLGVSMFKEALEDIQRFQADQGGQQAGAFLCSTAAPASAWVRKQWRDIVVRHPQDTGCPTCKAMTACKAWTCCPCKMCILHGWRMQRHDAPTRARVPDIACPCCVGLSVLLSPCAALLPVLPLQKWCSAHDPQALPSSIQLRHMLHPYMQVGEIIKVEKDHLLPSRPACWCPPPIMMALLTWRP